MGGRREMIKVLSLGAGVQSSTLALMAAAGEIGQQPDCAIFADTGEESGETYRHLDWLISVLPFTVHVVRAWDGYGNPSIKSRLGDEIIAATKGEGKAGSHSRPPFFTLGADGSKGMIRRQCTGDYKIDVIQAKERELLGLKKGQRWPKEKLIEQWIGISADEATRAKPIMQRRKRGDETYLSPHPTITARWPLLEIEMSRDACLRWLAERGYPIPPKSSCVFCPFHSDDEWRAVKQDPDAWARAVEIDEAIRTGLVSKTLTGGLFLHPARVALVNIDFTVRQNPQLNLFENECEGMCGV